MQTYFPAFEACVREGQAASIMCSYNAVNGVPSCANGAIQNDIVRKQWGYQGFFVSQHRFYCAVDTAFLSATGQRLWSNQQYNEHSHVS